MAKFALFILALVLCLSVLHGCSKSAVAETTDPSGDPTQESTVLKVIPAGCVGWMRLNNLANLNEEVDEVMRKITPPGDTTPPGIILKALGELVPFLDVSNSSELEERGMDARKDMAFFCIGASFQKPVMAVYVKDGAQAEASLQGQGKFIDVEYRGVPYKLSDGAAFVFLDDVLIYGASESDIRECIETHLKVKKSLLEDPGYVNLDVIWKSATNDLVAYIALDKVHQTYIPVLRELTNEAKSRPFVKPVLWLLEQPEFLVMSATIDTRGVTMDQFLKFKSSSSIQDLLMANPQPLELLHLLPRDASIAGGMTIDAKASERIIMAFTDVLADILREADPDISPKDFHETRQLLLGSLKDSAAFTGTEAAFAMSGKADMRSTFLIEITDEKAATKYMADYEIRMQELVGIYRKLGWDDAADALSKTKSSPEEVYEGVQIQSIQLTEEVSLPVQQFQKVFYALHSGKLIISIAPDSMDLKRTLDVIAGRTEGFDHTRGFEEISRELAAESNFALYFSPLKLGIQMALERGAPLPRAVLDGLESGIALGVSADFRDEGIASRLYISVDETQHSIASTFRLIQLSEVERPLPQVYRERQKGSLRSSVIASGPPLERIIRIYQDTDGSFLVTSVNAFIYRVTVGGDTSIIAVGHPFTGLTSLVRDRVSNDLIIVDRDKDAIFRMSDDGKIQLILQTEESKKMGDIIQDIEGDDWIITDRGQASVYRINQEGEMQTIATSLDEVRGIIQDRETGDFVACACKNLIRIRKDGSLVPIIKQDQSNPFNLPNGLVQDRISGDFFVVDECNLALYRITPAGVISKVSDLHHFPIGIIQERETDDFIITIFPDTILRLSGFAEASEAEIRDWLMEPASEVTLYTINHAGDLVKLEIAPGSVEPVVIGNLGEPFYGEGAEGIATSSDGVIYAAVSVPGLESQLYCIDPQTAEATLIGTMNERQVDGLSFSKDGTLYGVTSILGEGYDSRLIKVDVNTGETEPVRSGLESRDPDSLAIGPDGRAIITDGMGIDDQFYRMDLAGESKPIPIGPTPDIIPYGRDIEGLTFGDDGFLYGVTNASQSVIGVSYLARINPGTFEYTILSNLGFGASCLASSFTTRELAVEVEHVSESGSCAAWAPDSKMIAYGHDGEGGIWIFDLDSKCKTQLVAEGKDPAWSPDGQVIAYILQKEYEEVWVVQADGSEEPEYLVVGLYPHWTADGKEVVYFSEEEQALCAIDYKNRKTRQITPLDYAYTILSPDEKRMAYVGPAGGLWVADVDKPESRIRLAPTETGLLMTWSPDGRYIAYGGFLYNSLGIWVVPTDGSQAPRPIYPMSTKPVWSPDGKFIAFDNGIINNSGIAVMNVSKKYKF